MASVTPAKLKEETATPAATESPEKAPGSADGQGVWILWRVGTMKDGLSCIDAWRGTSRMKTVKGGEDGGLSGV
jgi:hypothetical protein